MTRKPLRSLIPIFLAAVIFALLPSSPARAILGSVSATWPGTSIPRGYTANVSGHVTGLELSDTVFLQQKVLGGWRNVAQTRLDSARNYKMALPTWWLGSRTYRVMTGSLLNTTLLGTASVSWTGSIRPTYSATGSTSSHAYTSTTPARWDPCKTIGYRVYPGVVGSGAITDTKTAMTQMGYATGFTFVYRGTTTRVPQNGGNSWYPTDTQIVVAWAKPAQSTMLQSFPTAVGVGAAITSGGWANGDGTSTSKIIRGAVVINSTKSYPGGFGTGKTRGDVILHELGHTMGLAHIGATDQMMYRYVTGGPARFNAGDLHGLYRRGAKNGCVVAPKYRTASFQALKVIATP